MSIPVTEGIRRIIESEILAQRGGYDVILSSRTDGPTTRIAGSGGERIAQSTHGPVFNLVCGFKPFAIAAALWTLETVAALEVERPLVWPPGSTASLSDVLCHRVGLHDVDALTYLGSSELRRMALRDRCVRPLVTIEPSVFSEVGVLVLLNGLLQHCAAMTLIEAVDYSAEAQGLPHTFSIRPKSDPTTIGVLLERTDTGSLLPLMQDRMPAFYGNPSSAFVGGYSSVADMAKFYGGLAALTQGLGREGLPTPELWNRVRKSGSHEFAGGLARLQSQGFDGLPWGVLGQVGFGQSSFGFFDEEGNYGFGVVRAIDFRNLGAVREIWAKVLHLQRMSMELAVTPSRKR